MAIDLDVVFKGIAGAAGAIGSIFTLVRSDAIRSRLTSSLNLSGSLRADAELLSKLDADSPAASALRASIEARVLRRYGPGAQAREVAGVPDTSTPRPEGASKKKTLGLRLYGLVMVAVFSVWTAYIVRDGFRWWAILTGFFAFSGLGLLVTPPEEGPPAGRQPRATAGEPGESQATKGNAPEPNGAEGSSG